MQERTEEPTTAERLETVERQLDQILKRQLIGLKLFEHRVGLLTTDPAAAPPQDYRGRRLRLVRPDQR
jgi:hypothetical protein